MTKKTALVLGAVLAALIGVIILTLYLLQSQQEVRSRASEEPVITPAAIQQDSCPTPAQADGVKVEFPNCVGSVCNFTQASCSWNSVAGATNYQVKISQVESGEVVRNDQVEAAITKVEFPIVQGKTYKCDISTVNSCGNVSSVASDQLLCQADALIPTASPTAAPTLVPTTPPLASATPTLIPTKAPVTMATSTPVPTLVPTGISAPTIGILGGILLLIVIGVIFVAI